MKSMFGKLRLWKSRSNIRMQESVAIVFKTQTWAESVVERRGGRLLKRLFQRREIGSPFGLPGLEAKLESGFEERRGECRYYVRLLLVPETMILQGFSPLLSSSQQFSTLSFPVPEENRSYLHASQVLLFDSFLAGGPYVSHYSFLFSSGVFIL